MVNVVMCLLGREPVAVEARTDHDDLRISQSRAVSPPFTLT